MSLPYLYIERYKTSEIKKLISSAKDLKNDIYVVVNAFAGDLSNGSIKGTNGMSKMVKCTMYGHCEKQLLSAKLMYCNPSSILTDVGKPILLNNQQLLRFVFPDK